MESVIIIKKIILLILLLILAMGIVSASDSVTSDSINAYHEDVKTYSSVEKSSGNVVKNYSKVSTFDKKVFHSKNVTLTAYVKDFKNKSINRGNVTFKIGNANLGTVNLSKGKASLTLNTSKFKAGSFTVKSIFNSNNYISSSNLSKLYVLKHNVAVNMSNVNALYSQKVVINATLFDKTANTTIAHGNVKFKVGNNVIGIRAIKNNHVNISVDTRLLGSGKYIISAFFEGNDILKSANRSSILHINKMKTYLNYSVTQTSLSSYVTVNIRDVNSKKVNVGLLKVSRRSDNIANVNVSNGQAKFVYVPNETIKGSSYTLKVHYSDINYLSNSIYIKINRNISFTSLTSSKVYFGKNVFLFAYIKNKEKENISVGNVTFTLNGKKYNSPIRKGKSILRINSTNLGIGQHKVSVIFSGNNLYKSSRSNATVVVSKLDSILTLPKVHTKTHLSTVISAFVRDANYNNVSGGFVNFYLNGNHIGKSEVNNGLSKLVYLPANIVCNYSLKAVYSGNSFVESCLCISQLDVSLNVFVMKWGSAGNIKNNRVLYNNLTRSSITDDLINSALSGSPYVILGDGNGKTVFVVAGIHGNELSSQSASVSFINAYASRPIHGTVYVFPFVAPSYTSKNTRTLNGVNLNRVANKVGSISNRIYNFAKSKNASALGDFHCSRPGGKPGCDSVFGSYSPRYESGLLAKYIANNVGLTSIIYSKAGVEYPSALEDYCNLNGITSVTCEVKTPHGTIAKRSVETSLNSIIHFLKYYSLL